MKFRLALLALLPMLFASLLVSAPSATAEGVTESKADLQCFAVARDPDPLVSTSRVIHAVGDVTGCTSRPDNCRLEVDLEQYNGHLGYWTTVAHRDSGWKAGCRRAWWGGYPTLDTPYTCTYDPDVQWGYRTVIYFSIEDNGDIATERAESTNDKKFWCF